jgi:hypothetical protein
MSTPLGESGRVFAFGRDLKAGGNTPEAQINRMAMAIFDERCPGIRWEASDYPHYRTAAIAALISLGIMRL